MKKKVSNPLPPELQAEVDALAAIPDEKINTEDTTNVQDWSGAKRGLFYRPIKKQITLRLDADLIEWFKEHHQPDEGYQTFINRALREYISHQKTDSKEITRSEFVKEIDKGNYLY